jgi:hypothetical protein
VDAKNVIISQNANPAGIESAQNVEQAVVQLAKIVSDLSGVGVGTESDPIYTADKPNIALKSELTPKADKTYVDSQDANLQSQIDAIVTFSETDPYYNADKPNIALKTEVAPKADTTYVDSQDAGLQSQITALGTNKADKTYVDTQDAALQSAIDSTNTALTSKADKTYVDSQDAALQTAINGKLTGSGVAGRVAYYDTASSTTSSANFTFNAVTNRLDLLGSIRSYITSGTSSQVLLSPDTDGPRIKYGTVTDAAAFMEMGAYNGQNNIDTKSRNLVLFTNSAPNAVNILGSTGYLGLNTANAVSRFCNTSTQQLFTNGIGVDAATGINWIGSAASLAVLRNSGLGSGVCGLSVQTDASANTNVIFETASGVNKSQKFAVLGTGDSVFSGNVQIRNTFPLYNQVTSFTADTVGDIRTTKVGGSLQVQICTVANAVKGAGTWVQQSASLTSNTAVYSPSAGSWALTHGGTLTGITIGATEVDLTATFGALANTNQGPSPVFYDSVNNVFKFNSAITDFTAWSIILRLSGTASTNAAQTYRIYIRRPTAGGVAGVSDGTVIIQDTKLKANGITAFDREVVFDNMTRVFSGGTDPFQQAGGGFKISAQLIDGSGSFTINGNCQFINQR